MPLSAGEESFSLLIHVRPSRTALRLRREEEQLHARIASMQKLRLDIADERERVRTQPVHRDARGRSPSHGHRSRSNRDESRGSGNSSRDYDRRGGFDKRR